MAAEDRLQPVLEPAGVRDADEAAEGAEHRQDLERDDHDVRGLVDAAVAVTVTVAVRMVIMAVKRVNRQEGRRFVVRRAEPPRPPVAAFVAFFAALVTAAAPLAARGAGGTFSGA